MSSKRNRKSLKKWSVAEKLEIVQAMERGLTYREILTLYGVHSTSLVKWNRAYAEKGIAGLELMPRLAGAAAGRLALRRSRNANPGARGAAKIPGR